MNSSSVGVVLWILLALPPSRHLLEADLVTHQYVQLIALAAVGYLTGLSLRHRWDRAIAQYNHMGIPGLLLAAFTLLVWLLPRSLDASLLNIRWEVAKFISVPLLMGLPLSFSWPRLSRIGQSFVIGNLAAMLTTMGALLLAAPQRLCTNYLITAQRTSGEFSVAVGLALAVVCVVYAVVMSEPDTP